MKKKLIKIANEIVELEKEFISGEKNVAFFTERFDKITEKLSVNDLLAIDEYIVSNQLLEK